jgi:uncharacterized protein YkwD
VAGAVSGQADSCTVPDDSDELAAEIIRLVNQERTGRGLDPVSHNPQLADAADDYGCTMIRDGYFGHYHPVTGEGPGERTAAAGYRYRAVGENLAAGQRTPAEVVDDWMNSTEGHRENILNPMWSDVGVGVRTGGEYGIYWVLEFGLPWPAIAS